MCTPRSVWVGERWPLGAREEMEHFNLTAVRLTDYVFTFDEFWSHLRASFPGLPLFIFVRLTGLFC